MKILLFLFLFLVTATGSFAQSMPDTVPVITEETDKLLFLILKIKRAEDSYQITLTDKKIVDGTMKVLQPFNSDHYKEGDVIVFLMDNNRQKIDSVFINQPLRTRYEYPDENGIIGSTIVIVPETEVVIRRTYHSNIKFMQVEEIKGNKRTQVILLLPLTEF